MRKGEWLTTVVVGFSACRNSAEHTYMPTRKALFTARCRKVKRLPVDIVPKLQRGESNMRGFFGKMIAVLLSSFLAVWMAPVSAQPPDPTLDVNVPAGPLESVLRKFAEDHKLQILFAPDDVKGLATLGARG